MSGFVHLHAHSTFSFLDGYGTPEQIRDRVIELGQHAVAVTDHGSVFGHVPYARAFKNSGVRPIFGVEAYIVDDVADRSRVQSSFGASAFPHITLLAKDQKGYENLLSLNKYAWETGFYYKPRIDHKSLVEHSEGLVVLSGCPGGYPTRLLCSQVKDLMNSWGILEYGPDMADIEEIKAFEDHNYQVTRDFMRSLRDSIEHYYVEFVAQPDLWESQYTSSILYQIASELGIPFVITADAHFPRPEDHEAEDTLLCVGLGMRRDDPERNLRLPEYQYYCSREELRERALRCFPTSYDWSAAIDQALDNTVAIADMCYVEIPRGKPVSFPSVPVGHTADTLLWEMVSNALLEKWSNGKIPFDDESYRAYYDRALHEYETIKRKGFSDYILAVVDVVKWAKDQGGLVMVRGSAGGCLMLWLLDTSATDPLLHGLSFERFYDDNRPDPPDVDIDFERRQRDLAIEYIFEKYGRERCSQIAALSTLKAKAALQDAAFALGIPRGKFSALSAALDSKDDDLDRQLSSVTDPDVLKVLSEHPELMVFEKLIGQCRQSSVHAAGVLISSMPLDKVIGTVLGKDKKLVAAVDKYGAADVGLLKLDFLSVNSLDIISMAARTARGSVNWLYDLDLNDDKALLVAAAGRLAGVFQLDGASAARTARQIGIDTFADVVAASALCRPGPGDWVETYSKFKHDPVAFARYLQSFAPTAQEIVRETYGIILYQEQVMRFARELAGFSWPDVHKLRKGITSSAGPDWMEEWQAKFIDGCATSGVSRDESLHWWKSIATHGGYSFNKAHCFTYGVIGYWDLYLKAHYPAAFCEACLALESDGLIRKKIIGEFNALGGQVSLYDHRFSRETFRAVSDKWIVGGLTSLKGVGAVSAKKIVSKMPFNSPAEFFEALPKSTRESLQRAADCGWDPIELIPLASWFPVTQNAIEDDILRDQYAAMRPGQIRRLETTYNAVFAGYVSLIDISKDKIVFLTEDDSGPLIVRVGQMRVSSMLSKAKTVSLGCFALFGGFWDADRQTFYTSDIAVLRERPQGKTKEHVPETSL